MVYKTLISTSNLNEHLNDPNWVIVDCRFSLADTELGRRSYAESHIPGAVYAHLDDDLSGPIIPGQTGRHPLPKPDAFAKTLSDWGVDEAVQVVAYDNFGGAIAARLWWMLRWLGHDAVAVLDGGWPVWATEDRPKTDEASSAIPRNFIPQVRHDLVALVEEVPMSSCILDARSADRYRGENETIDPIGGHIPRALSAPFTENLDETGRFRSPETLKARFKAILGERSPAETVIYCGSGVTANHNLLAMAHAGLDGGRLYPGSWSEWITDANRPVAIGG